LPELRRPSEETVENAAGRLLDQYRNKAIKVRELLHQHEKLEGTVGRMKIELRDTRGELTDCKTALEGSERHAADVTVDMFKA
jgi:hypothetical protein